MQNHKHVLTIGGSDPSGHAGIQADIQTLSSLGSIPLAIPTALTSQNSQQITHTYALPSESILTALQALLADTPIHAIKTGMLYNLDVINILHQHLPNNVPLIIDPILLSSSGTMLLPTQAIKTLETTLFPRASLITPNIPEMETLLGEKYQTQTAFITAIQAYLKKHTIKAILLKGGHSTDETVTDILITPSNSTSFHHPRLEANHYRGTGCCLSACIAHFLAQSFPLEIAIEKSHQAIFRALSNAFSIGQNPHFKHLNFHALTET